MPRRPRTPALLATALALAAGRGLAAQPAPPQPAPPRPPSAQAAAGLRLLALPEGQPMLCRAPDPAPDDPPAARGLVRREFRFAAPSAAGLPPGVELPAPREVDVAYDSTGRPLLLSDRTSALLRGAETVLAVFGPDGAVGGGRVDIAADSAKIVDALASGDPGRASDPGLMRPPVARELTAEEGAGARALAAWLWARRCGGAAVGAAGAAGRAPAAASAPAGGGGERVERVAELPASSRMRACAQRIRTAGGKEYVLRSAEYVEARTPDGRPVPRLDGAAVGVYVPAGAPTTAGATGPRVDCRTSRVLEGAVPGGMP